MISLRPLVLVTVLASAVGGCATVAVYEPVDAAEITFAQPNSDLRNAADEYCEGARERGLARGASTFGGLAGALLGNETPVDAYWSAIEGDSISVQQSALKVREDLRQTTSGLQQLIGLATEVVETGQPGRTDVGKFESALIHARQSRQSLSSAIKRIGEGGGRQSAALLADLGVLDNTINDAVTIADRLAEARTSDSVA